MVDFSAYIYGLSFWFLSEEIMRISNRQRRAFTLVEIERDFELK